MPTKTIDSKEFDIEHQYQLYLSRVALSEEMMHPEQKRQMKMTFYGAFGQTLLLLRDEVATLNDDDAIKVLDGIVKQVADYYLLITGKQN